MTGTTTGGRPVATATDVGAAQPSRSLGGPLGPSSARAASKGSAERPASGRYGAPSLLEVR